MRDADIGAFLTDNVLSHPMEIAAYLRALEALPGFDRVILPVGRGVECGIQVG